MPKVLIFLIVGTLEPAYQQAVGEEGAILVDGFETGSVQSTLWNESSSAGCNPTVPSAGAFEGKHYLRSELTAKPDGGNFRCEQNAKSVGSSAQLNIPYYYHFALRVPNNFAYDTEADDTIMQLHQGAGSGSHHGIRIKDRVVNWYPQGSAGGNQADLATLVRGQWMRFCVRAVWSTTASGSLKIWVNPGSESSTPAYKYEGRTLNENYIQIGKFKIGLYKSKWRSNPPSPGASPRVIEHDDVRVGLTFAQACGGGGTTPEPPTSLVVTE